MSMLDYRGLAALDAVVEQGSFEKAASALSITQSAVSHRLRALEEASGELLVIRSQPPQATARGHRLIAHYRQVLLLEAGLQAEAPEPAALPQLAIAANADSAATWLLEALASVLAEPVCRVEVLLDDQDQTLRQLREGRVVGCITSSPDAVAGTSVVALGVMSYRCVATPAFARRWFADGLNAQSVAVAPAVIYNRSDTLHGRYLAQMGLDQDVPHSYFPSAQGFVAFIQAGFGYGMAPVIQVREELADGRLIDLAPGTQVPVALYWHRWNIQTALTRTLNDAIVATAARWLEQAPGQIIPDA
ncbi:LysR family transcriptional regulator, chromosome initiation inhibitor [Janthinobacterium psychrotolerans]|uniref:LysR family transcriptional regulator, chromosome initiation inhibitor n=2 Tax=Janthinobacterium psychrotolerans TaxID=1747903 RepID=A0A1A7C2Q0_9BURK|nr:LysR family transcriptional regulator, chromosome initiation inhibitor [Janthinobacterium psychrotolerans]